MDLSVNTAEQLALDFFLEDWEIVGDDRDFFAVVESRAINQ